MADQMNNKCGFGGGCHWCTEAIFQSVPGVSNVEQGWIAPQAASGDFSEAVIVHFDPSVIQLELLIDIHLDTHSSTRDHALRAKYRSAIYVFSDEQARRASACLRKLQQQYPEPIITRVLPFGQFKMNRPQYLNYYYNDADKPFCQNVILPKLRQLRSRLASGK